MRYRVIGSMLQANLVLGLEAGTVTSAEARLMMDELHKYGKHHTVSEEDVTSCLLDFKQAMNNSRTENATVSVIAQRFEELLIFDEFTEGELEVNQEVIGSKEALNQNLDLEVDKI